MSFYHVHMSPFDSCFSWTIIVLENQRSMIVTWTLFDLHILSIWHLLMNWSLIELFMFQEFFSTSGEFVRVWCHRTKSRFYCHLEITSKKIIIATLPTSYIFPISDPCPQPRPQSRHILGQPPPLPDPPDDLPQQQKNGLHQNEEEFRGNLCQVELN